MADNLTNISVSLTFNISGTTYQFHQTEQLIFLCVLFGLILIGNTLVLIAIISSGKRRSRMNMFIINLACADLAVGCLFVLTDIIWKVTITWYAGNILCKLIKFAQGMASYGATYSLVAFSIDRFDAIARPMNMTDIVKRCRLLLGSVWTFAALFSTPMLFLYREQTVEGLPQCWIELSEKWMWQVYMTLVSLAVFILPAIIIASCYIIIVVIIWNKSSKFRATGSKKSSDKSSCLSRNGSAPVNIRSCTKSHSRAQMLSSSRGVIPKAKIKTIKMTFVIVLAFILCWLPYFIWDLLSVYDHISISQQTIAISTFIQSLAPLNSAANPIIYTLFNTAMCTRMLRQQKTFSSPMSQGFSGQ